MAKNSPKGLLYMAANSLGNPADIPQRSLDAVKEADLLIFEEDRPARAVLKAAGVHKEYLKYNEQHQQETLDDLKKALSKGKTAVYMSDQGCPTLEDPGLNILKAARYCKAKVKVIPGPSSLTAALSACPFKRKTFEFHGFPPRDEHKRAQFLTKLKGREKLQVIMDTPYRLKKVIETCSQVFSAECYGFIALDISGPDEDYLMGTFEDLYKEVQAIEKKLNFVLIIQPYVPQKQFRNNGRNRSRRR